MKLYFLLVAAFYGVVSAEDCTTHRCVIAEDTLRFFLVGDFGGQPITPYYSGAQHHVAKAMKAMGGDKNTHFQIELGDNFYTKGVKNVHSHRFHDTFEKVYTGPAMMRPWYIVGGNHDHYGNASAQIAYSKISQRWTYPNLYYTFKYSFANGKTADFIVVDTPTLCGRNIEPEDWLHESIFGSDDPEPDTPDDPWAANAQWQWMEQQMASSTADFLFLMGHFPVYSNAEHGPNACLVAQLTPLLARYKASAYFNGHDHNLQHLKVTKDDWETHYIVSGAGSRSDPSCKHAADIPPGSLQYRYPKCGFDPISQLGFGRAGFAYAELSANGGFFSLHNKKGGHEYNFTLPLRPRNDIPLEDEAAFFEY